MVTASNCVEFQDGTPAKLPMSLFQAKGPVFFICIPLLGVFDSFRIWYLLTELGLTSVLLLEQKATVTHIKWGFLL